MSRSLLACSLMVVACTVETPSEDGDGGPILDVGAVPLDVPPDAGPPRLFVEDGLAVAAARFEEPSVESAALAIFEPETGVLVPLNLPRLEFALSAGFEAYELRFDVGDDAPFRARFACSADDWCRCSSANQCEVTLPGDVWSRIANQGRGRTIRVGALAIPSDTAASPVAGASVEVRIAEAGVRGGLYFWDVGNGDILRFDFDRATDRAETFLSAGAGRAGATGRVCVGCHVIDASGARMLVGGETGADPMAVYDVASRERLASLMVGGPSYATGSFDGPGARVAVIDNEDSLLPPYPNHATLYIADSVTGAAEAVATELRPGSGTRGAADLSWSPVREELVYAPVDVVAGLEDRGPGRVTLTVLERSGEAWNARDLIERFLFDGDRAPSDPSFLPGGDWIAYADYRGTCAGEACAIAPVDYAMIRRTGGPSVRLERAFPPVTLPTAERLPYKLTCLRFAPTPSPEGDETLIWGVVASIRPFGTSQVGSQLWMFALRLGEAEAGRDPSTLAFHLPFQTPGDRYLLGQWSSEIVRRPCEDSSVCEGGEFCEEGRCVPELF